jgi:cohesin loading factor subunit SCC2
MLQLQSLYAPCLLALQADIDFTRYMAENFSAFDYKTQEEVFLVIKYLTSVLSTSGMQLVEVLSPSNLLGQLHEQLSSAPNMQVTVNQ